MLQSELGLIPATQFRKKVYLTYQDQKRSLNKLR